MSDAANNGQVLRGGGNEPDDFEDEENAENANFNPGEYDLMLRLEQLESLEEEMEELGVKTLDEVRARIADLHRQLDQQQGR